MSDLLGGRGSTPGAHNAAEGGAQAKTGGTGLSYGVALNANEFRNLTSNGKRITPTASAAQVSTVFVQEINLPSMCQIVYTVDEHWTESDFAQFKIGSKLGVSDLAMSADAQAPALPPMYVSGMSFEARAESGGRSTLTVVAFDKLHWLRFGAYTKPFVKQTDEKIFESLASAAGLTLSAIGLRGGAYPYVLQDNETNFDFLLRRCRQANYECMIAMQQKKEKLVVRPSAQGQPPGKLALVYKQDIEAITLDMRVPTVGSPVASWGYDVSKGEWMMGYYDEDTERDKMKGQTTGFQAVRPFAPAPITLRRPDLPDNGTLEYVAAAARSERQAAFVEGTATLRNINMKTSAGVNVEIKGLNIFADGWYYIVKSTHQRDRHGDHTVLDLRRSGI